MGRDPESNGGRGGVVCGVSWVTLILLKHLMREKGLMGFIQQGRWRHSETLLMRWDS